MIPRTLDVLEMIDRVVVAYVIAPKVTPAPPEGTPRKPNVLYVDDVDLEDKGFVFSFVVGGTANIVKWREEVAPQTEGGESDG